MFRNQLTLSVLAAASALLPAQRPSNWTTITMPANATTAPNSIGTTTTFLTTNSVYLYSGVTKEWTVIPVAAPAPIFQANDYCIVRDGNLIHGFSSHTGTVSTITTSGSPAIVSGSASSSWVTLVAEGTQAWAFGAFHGQWETVTLSQPNPLLLANRLTGLVQDGNTVYGVSAHHGTFVPVAADASALLSVLGEGEVGTANSPDILRGFSAQQNTWAVQSVPGSTGAYQQNEYAMMWAGNQIWAYSGLTGTMASYTANQPISGVTGAEGVAAFLDGTDTVLYGSGRGQFVARQVSGPGIVFDYHLALLDEGTQVTPFSGITGAFGATLPGNFLFSTSDEIAYATDGANSYAYSPILNTWTPAPITLPNSVSLVRSSVVLGDASGYWALSARRGQWVFQASGLPGQFQAPTSGATFAAVDGVGETLHVFDSRLSRWATVTGQAPLTVRISRHTIMAHDGSTAFGFGQPTSEWFAQPLTTAPSSFDTASSIGTVRHGNELSVYCVQGSFSYTGRYPEFTQAVNLGNTMRMHQVAPPNSFLLFLVAFGGGYLDVRPTVDGIVFVDPASTTTLFWPQAVDGDGILDMVFPIPNNPAFAGLQLHMQNLVLPPTGQPWLSSSVAPIVF
ncbi:MAG: hypothetical protein IT456_22505 [Planctomycetes bacterium]|jgi:hypothetical protein|nr:hypothetical protein [Planctomycetota bacterium]